MAKQNYSTDRLHLPRAKAALVGRYQVIDSALLREIVGEVRSRAEGGKLARAAKRVGLDPPELWALGNKHRKGIHASIFAKLMSLTLARFRVWRVVLGETGQELLGGYTSWMHASLTRVISDEARWTLGRHGVEMLEPRKGHSHRAAIAKAILTEIRGSPLSSFLNAFEDFAHKRGHSPARIELALYRIVEPFFASAESGFVELSWGDLNVKQRKAYLNASCARERVLLSRVGDVQRLQRIERLSADERSSRRASAPKPVRLSRGVGEGFADVITLPNNFRYLGLWSGFVGRQR